MSDVKSRPCFLTPRRSYPDRPLFVFLPGMDGTGQLLRAQTAGLEKGFDIRTLAIPPDDLTGWDELAGMVVRLIEKELETIPDRPVYLCGESFGGCLAIKVLLKAPQLFHRVVLVNPASSFGRRPWISWGSELTRYLPESVYQISSVTLLPLLGYFRRMLPADRQAFLETVSAVPQKTSIWRLSLLSEFRVSEEQLHQIAQPVLILASGADLLLPSLVEAQRLASLLPHAQVVELPDSGHACLLEAEVNLYEILCDHGFLDSPNFSAREPSLLTMTQAS